MDVALAVFNIGAGLGVLAAGLSLAYLAWRVTPLIRESRALTADLRRLTATTETELRPILAHAREVARNAEVLSEDAAVKLDRLSDLMNALQRSLETAQLTAASRPPEAWPLEGPVEGPELWPVEGADAGPAEGSELWPVERPEPAPPEPSEPWPAERAEPGPAEPSEPWPVERPDPWPVESWETREDPSGS